MINLFFFLKFKNQLRRTQPDLVNQIDESLIRSITDAGGKITGNKSVISAVLNEETIGIWLDMYILIENLKESISASSEFFGYSLVISGDLPNTPESLCRFLANGNGGIFMDTKTIEEFLPYASFEKPSQWSSGRKSHKYGSDGFCRIKGLRVFKSSSNIDSDLLNDTVLIFEQHQNENVLITGKVFSQARNGLYAYCKKTNKDFPVLSVCFGSIGLGSIVDAWSQRIRSLSAEQPAEELDRLWELLFRERIRDEVSDFIIRNVKRFLSLLLDYYINAAQKKKRTPILVLENIHLAGKKIVNLLLEALNEINSENREKLLILGTADDEILPEKTRYWEGIFDKIETMDSKKYKPLYIPRLTMELWEIIYAISLFGRYFSPELFQRLFEEEEKNPVMISRAFSILNTLGVIDNPREPWPLNKFYEERSRRILGDKANLIKAMVNRRLLNWANKRNINPCFRLLTVIFGLEGANQIDDLLLLKSITSDIVSETTSGLELALKNGHLEELVSAQRAVAIRYIFKTSRALYTGKEHDIDKVFMEQTVDGKGGGFDDFPVLKAQIIVNFCGYYLGRRDIAMAVEKAKEAIMLGQSKNNFCLPQAYRLFSLACLSKQQTTETIEYLNFALANAEKTGNYHEMGITSYYAAASQFLYGDVFKALQLSKKSVEQSIAAGRPDWADRSRFLEGRVYFELGNYREAQDIFDALRKNPYGGNTKEKDSLFEAWVYRAKIYLRDTSVSKPEPASHDADLFEIEAAYLEGDYQKAVELSGVLNNPFSKDNFLYTEQPNWSSGFAQCEHLYFTHGEIQDRMICLFNSLSLSHLSTDTDAVQKMQRILRDERLCEMDPWDAFYFYAKYLILKQTGSSQVDMSTAVSMAFKRLQRRASRIDDIETRRQYLNGSRWNRELYLTAKEFKLI
ncbi:MAG: tetratricopeptide repeat protein [Treponema sp.]|jgi:tetratricopeptide (TPR) repeat protein|nr:tetratricopeptide repeat protein [Treponema sp.]